MIAVSFFEFRSAHFLYMEASAFFRCYKQHLTAGYLVFNFLFIFKKENCILMYSKFLFKISTSNVWFFVYYFNGKRDPYLL